MKDNQIIRGYEGEVYDAQRKIAKEQKIPLRVAFNQAVKQIATEIRSREHKLVKFV